ncbi:MAG: molybdopterin molybdenumtransferase MoeA, partial [Gammaproteobacteria bacterium]|nr:molybdopterin molybdenumtransferase MoeA [Gammaproteobacteria bacterium]
LLASLGIPEVQVKRRLRVAFFSTGDELRSLGQVLGEGEIYDSNRYTLYSMLTDMDCDIIDMGVIPDQPDAIRDAFQTASINADVVLTSGGVSVGDADYVKMILDDLGKIDFWKLNMKPGRPLAFGQLNKAMFFGLPGNPVAVMVTFFQFVIPAIRKMMGEESQDELTINAICQTKLKKNPGRTEFQRGIMSRNEAGEMIVTSSGSQGAGILSSISRSNCLIILDEAQGTVEAGDTVSVQPYINFMR